MAPLLEHSSQRSTPTPFLTKTYQLVDDHSIDHVISWNETGSSFIVWNPILFAKDFLPKYFKHNNFSSFVRQLNTYGFRKLVPDRWEFSNDCFRRGEKRLLSEIQRRKINSASPPAVSNIGATANVAIPITKPIVSPSNSAEEQVISSNSSLSSVPAELLDENERLRRENFQLTQELEELRSVCNNILNLVSNYANAQEEATKCSGEEAAAMAVDEMNPKLFGVTIGTKRAKRKGVGAEENTVLSLHQSLHANLKSEPFDFRHGENRKSRWLKQCHIANERVCN